jgi:hypothetical protein
VNSSRGGTRDCKRRDDVKIQLFPVEGYMTFENVCGIPNGEYVTDMPPSQGLYEYGCLLGYRGRVRGTALRKSMLKPSLPIRLPLGGLADPLNSCAACAIYLPEGGKGFAEHEGDKFC